MHLCMNLCIYVQTCVQYVAGFVCMYVCMAMYGHNMYVYMHNIVASLTDKTSHSKETCE